MRPRAGKGPAGTGTPSRACAGVLRRRLVLTWRGRKRSERGGGRYALHTLRAALGGGLGGGRARRPRRGSRASATGRASRRQVAQVCLTLQTRVTKLRTSAIHRGVSQQSQHAKSSGAATLVMDGGAPTPDAWRGILLAESESQAVTKLGASRVHVERASTHAEGH